jgi:hypothetical protein
MATINAISVALFNAAAGGYSAEMEKNGAAFANAVGPVLEKDISTDALFVEHLLGNLGVLSTSAVYAQAKAAIAGLVTTKGRLGATVDAIDFLKAQEGSSSAYATIAATFAAKVNAAAVFSASNATERDITKLISGVTGVDTDVAAVAAAAAAATAAAEAKAAAAAATAAAEAKAAADAAAAKAAAEAKATAEKVAADAAAAAKTAADAAAATAAAEAKAAAAKAAADLQAANDAITALQNPAGTSNALTSDNDTVITGKGNDTLTGIATTLLSGDIVVDSSTTDNDTLTLALTAAPATSPTVVANIENVVYNVTSFADVTLSAANFSGTKTYTINNLQTAGTSSSVLGSIGSGATVVAGTGVTSLQAVTAEGVTALTIQGGNATTLLVGQDAGTGTAAAVTLNVTSDKTTGATITLDGSAATARDTAVVTAKGSVALNTAGTVDSETNQVENLTLSGNGAAATYTIVGAPTAITVAGSQNVTVAGVASIFSGKTVTDTSSATSTVQVKTTAGALDLTKIAVDKVQLAVDMSSNTVTVDSGEVLAVSTNQTSLTLTSAIATRTTNSVSIDVNDGSSTVNTVALGQVAGTYIKTYNISATDNVTVANSSSFGSTGDVVFTGAGTVTLGTGVTANSINASAATGVVTATFASTLQTINTGSGDDSISVSADQDFSVDAGTGSDTLTIVSASTNLDFSDNPVTLSGVEIIQFDDSANATTHTFASSVLTGKALIVKGEGTGAAADVLAVAMDGTSVDLSGLNAQATTISKVAITSTAVAASALTVTGSAGVDEVTTGSQSDVIRTGDGNDTIVDSGDGDDQIYTGAGNDTVTQSGNGNDYIDLGAGTNTVTDSGAGNDTIIGGSGTDTVTDSGSGNDTITLANGTNTASGNSGDDVITGGTGVDTFTGGADKDTLTGLSGADKLYGDNAGTKEARTITIAGTQEAETLTFTAFGKAVTASALSTNSADANAGLLKTAIEDGLGSYVTVSAVSSGAITITSRIDGNLVDFAIAESSATQSNGSPGTATDGTTSSGGADTINAGTGADFVVGGEGKDIIDLGAADGDADTLVFTALSTAGGDLVTGFESDTGSDVITFAASQFVNGTPSATLASITSTGTVGTSDAFVAVTTTATAGVDTAAKAATFLANVGFSNVATSDKIVLALTDGTDTYLYYYQEAGTTGAAAAELTQIAKLIGVTAIANGDLAFI